LTSKSYGFHDLALDVGRKQINAVGLRLRVDVLPLELGSSGSPVVFFQRFNMEFEVSDDVTAHYPALLALKKQNIATASYGCLLAVAVRASQFHSEYEYS
jgi:hypothetical protein